MKAISVIIMFTLFCITSVQSQEVGKKLKYYDHYGKELSKKQFQNALLTYEYYEIPGDSINHKKLIDRIQYGKITNRSKLEMILNKNLEVSINSETPLVIIYYSGAEFCDLNTSVSSNNRKRYYRKLNRQVKKVTGASPIYIYKSYGGLKEKHDYLKWHKDPERTIEKLFFKYNFPCFSFTVISKDGEFVSRYGEFGIPMIVNAARLMTIDE